MQQTTESRFRRRWWTRTGDRNGSTEETSRYPTSPLGEQRPPETRNVAEDRLAAELEVLVRRELTEQGLDELFRTRFTPPAEREESRVTRDETSTFSEPSEARDEQIGTGPLSWQARLLESNQVPHQLFSRPGDESMTRVSEWSNTLRAGLQRLKVKLRQGDAEAWEQLKTVIVERTTWFLREQAEQQLYWKAMRQDPTYVLEDFTANQRTFFSWIRTSFRMVLTGAAIGKLLKGTPVIILGVLYAALGLLFIAIGTMHFYHWQRTLYDHRFLRDSRPFVIVFFGITATCAVGFVACWI
ncbi:hypothetical protein CCYA_CCYA17G4390 [Cyanidiococcus yangmingshanensis]|nr:hypothetical protein CCYA_CCYA17G4390 [Cyanidiococcus yangmingshanensis]